MAFQSINQAIRGIEIILRQSQFLAQQQLSLVNSLGLDLDGRYVIRSPHEASVCYWIGGPPYRERVVVDEMTMLRLDKSEFLDHILARTADAAFRMRGRMFRDLIIGWKVRPVELVDIDKPLGDSEATVLAERLGEALCVFARGDLAERVGIQLLERFQRGG